MRKRIAITGMGVIASAGKSVAEFVDNISAGRQFLTVPADPSLAHFGTRYAGLVREIPGEESIRIPGFSKLDRYIKLALGAAAQALKDARIDPRQAAARMGLYFGTCSGPMLTIEEHYSNSLTARQPLTFEEYLALQYYSATIMIASQTGISGPSVTVTTACSASSAAAGIAADCIRSGLIDYALVGGADSFSPTTFAGFAGLKALSESKCAPFSKPVGLNLGEGAAFLVLEDMERACERGAQLLGEFLGYGLSNDAYHCSAPDPSGKGASAAITRALSNAGVNKTDISYVNAHGTGTEANDKSETRAIRRALELPEGSLPVSSTKSMVGHCLGAAGSVELVASLGCAHWGARFGDRNGAPNGVLPPTAAFDVPREGCNLDYVAQSGRVWPSEKSIFLKNSFAFGGNNAAVVIDCKPGEEIRAIDHPDDDPVCITGIGSVTVNGDGTANLERSFDEVTGLDGREAGVNARRFTDFDPRSVDRRLDMRTMDRASRLAAVASWKALSEARLLEKSSMRSNIGFYLAIPSGSTRAESEHIVPLLTSGYKVSQVNAFPYIVPNSIGGNVCRVLSLTGHNTVLCDGPGGALSTLCMAAAALEQGHAPAFLCGGTDELTGRALDDFEKAGLNQHGEIPAEGAVLMVLERRSAATARNAVPLLEIAGYAMGTADVLSGSVARTTQLRLVIEEAVVRSGVTPEDIGTVCCRTTSELERSALMAVGGLASAKVVDVTGRIGCAQSTFPLVNLTASIAAHTIGKDQCGKYILTFFGTQNGHNCALVTRRPDPKE